MPDAEAPRRTISSTPRLSPEEITGRTFTSAFRGLSETEVRTFLRRVADDVAAGRQRERDLTSRVEEVEAELRQPPQLTEQQLLDTLGEETARVLRAAQDAALDIRSRAEERSSVLLREAQEEARVLREEAEQVLALRTTEAEERAAEVLDDATRRAAALDADAREQAAEVAAAAQRDADELKERAARETGVEIEQARTTGREMVIEARAVRERLLGDLAKRRSVLEPQLEELRRARERMLDAFRVVRRSYSDATEALEAVELAAATRPPSPLTAATTDGPPPAPDANASGPVLEAIEDSPAGGAASVEVVEVETTLIEIVEVEIDTALVVVAEDPAGGPVDAAAGGRPDVDALFARLRAGADEPMPEATVAETADAATDTDTDTDTDTGAETADEPTSASAPAALAPEPGSDAASLAARDAALAPLRQGLVRRAKRAAQDEQNAVLDRLRRQRGKPVVEEVLLGEDAQVAVWTDVLRDGVLLAHAAGAATVGEAPPVPDTVIRELAAAVIRPLRERLVDAISEGDDEDAPTRVGARFREWRGQALTDLAAEVLAVAYARGVYDAAPQGSMLRWIPAEVGRCPDCDDNALEPTVRGSSFPTGQAYPPAHPGCRCLVAVVAATAPNG